jgi:hypothetical protein
MAIFFLLGLFARPIRSTQFFPTSARLTRQPTPLPLSIAASRALPISPSPSSSTLVGPDSCQCAATGHPWLARLAYVVSWLAPVCRTLHLSHALRHATRLTLVSARPWPPTSPGCLARLCVPVRCTSSRACTRAASYPVGRDARRFPSTVCWCPVRSLFACPWW